MTKWGFVRILPCLAPTIVLGSIHGAHTDTSSRWTHVGTLCWPINDLGRSFFPSSQLTLNLPNGVRQTEWVNLFRSKYDSFCMNDELTVCCTGALDVRLSKWFSPNYCCMCERTTEFALLVCILNVSVLLDKVSMNSISMETSWESPKTSQYDQF